MYVLLDAIRVSANLLLPFLTAYPRRLSASGLSDLPGLSGLSVPAAIASSSESSFLISKRFVSEGMLLCSVGADGKPKLVEPKGEAGEKIC